MGTLESILNKNSVNEFTWVNPSQAAIASNSIHQSMLDVSLAPFPLAPLKALSSSMNNIQDSFTYLKHLIGQ